MQGTTTYPPTIRFDFKRPDSKHKTLLTNPSQTGRHQQTGPQPMWVDLKPQSSATGEDTSTVSWTSWGASDSLAPATTTQQLKDVASTVAVSTAESRLCYGDVEGLLSLISFAVGSVRVAFNQTHGRLQLTTRGHSWALANFPSTQSHATATTDTVTIVDVLFPATPSQRTTSIANTRVSHFFSVPSKIDQYFRTQLNQAQLNQTVRRIMKKRCNTAC